MAISQDVIARLRMLGAASFTTAAKTAASGVRDIGDAQESTAKKGQAFGKFMNKSQGTFTALGVASTRLAMGVGAAGVAAVGMGVKFNAGMEQSRVAFTNLLGSSSKANAMLNELYSIAAHTPFEFPQLTQATQRLIGFGMKASDVIPTMKAVGDAVAAAGGGADQIDRVSLALGQMQAKGRVSAEELNQMAESGVPALKILQEQLGLTGAQLAKKMQKGAVSADVGIAALVKGMSKRYKGAAAAQSKTFNGMLSTLKDNANQVLGALTGPLFTALEKNVLPAVAKVTDKISAWARGGGVQQAITALQAGFNSRTASETAGFGGALGKVAAAGRTLGVVFRTVKTYALQLWTALKPAQPFLQNVLIPLLKGFAIGALGSVGAALKILIPILSIFARILGWVGTKLRPFRGIIEKIGIVLGVVYGPAVLRAIGYMGKFGGAFRVVAGLAKALLLPIRALNLLFGRLAGLAAKGGAAMLRAFGRLGKSIVLSIAEGIKSAPGAIMGAIRSMLPGGKAAKFIRKAIPGLAGGGTVMRAGSVLVGERGPEVLRLPRSAQVVPLPQSVPSVPGINGSGMGGTFVAKLFLQNREIAQAVAQHTADTRARR